MKKIKIKFCVFGEKTHRMLFSRVLVVRAPSRFHFESIARSIEFQLDLGNILQLSKLCDLNWCYDILD